jgi:hypothetical protein
MIHKSDDGQHYFDQGKYSNIPLKHVPTEHLEVIIENWHTSNNLEKLRAVHICLDYKIKRIQDAVDKATNPVQDVVEIPKTIRRR